ncbi:MAG TPA: DUF3306 domain-containing protein [Pseudolabrys sp.]|nr:DUF3306 domain-containing protein [Pseudolabrys sp.]
MPQTKPNYAATLSTNQQTYPGSTGFINFCAALLLVGSVAAASAEENTKATTVFANPASCANPSTFDIATLPPLTSIDADTDITVFLHDGVPAGLRLAALRHAWSSDPAIRNFIGLQESDWDFNEPRTILGFGDIGPETDVAKMVAQIFGNAPQVVARAPERQPIVRVMLRLF